MLPSLYAELEWLPRPPADLSSRIRLLAEGSGTISGKVQALASFGLDLNQLTRLAKAIEKHRSTGGVFDGMRPFRLAVLSNGTMDLIVPALIASAARHAVDLEIVQPSYDQVAQEALNPDSEVNSARPDAVLFALDYRALPLALALGDADGAASIVERAFGYLQTLRQGIKANSNAVCIFQTFAPPAETLFGSMDVALPGTIWSILSQINDQIANSVLPAGDILLNIAGLADLVGLANWHNPRLWNLGKLQFSEHFIPLYAEHVARTLAALCGKSRKALILDLDNTVWGGVIGDDGLAGIKVAQGDAVGEAHLAVQRMALDLRHRGIVLAVCSKNTDEVARRPFQEHPEMLLKLEHFAVFQANWNDKATNIQAIAAELSLGLDAMVFLDDNPVERGLIRNLLPGVAVPELSEEPADYARTLAAAGYFEAVSFAEEDLKRAGFYQGNARRAALREQLEGVDAYLDSLAMTLVVQPFDATSRARIFQLINKSNQYNLTTRRYTDPEVAAMEADPETFTLQARLTDIFGDNGMISVVICKQVEPEAWEIDTWLMSCRVLGRKVEHAVLHEVLKHAEAAGIRTLMGVYRPTDRNKLVEDHYEKLGFMKVKEYESGESWWKIQIGSGSKQRFPMQIVSQGFNLVQASAPA